MTLTRKRRNRYLGAAGIALAIMVGVGTAIMVGGPDDMIPHPPGIRLQLYAARDLGALPNRDTWCSGSAHCWVFQQSTGDATDYGDTGGWHLSPVGSPRAGVPVHLPVVDATGWVDVGSEKAFFADYGANGMQRSGVTGDSTNLISFTVVGHMFNVGAIQEFGAHLDGSAYGWVVGVTTSDRIYYHWKGPGGGGGFSQSTAIQDGSWHCVTWVLDGRSANAARIYVNGADTGHSGDLSGVGSVQVTADLKLPRSDYGPVSGLARFRMDNSAVTLAQHQALCGDLWYAPAGGSGNTKPLYADDSWTQTGGASCYPTSSTTAICQPGGVPRYTVDATGLGWVVEPDATNRIAYNTAIDCTNWTCAGTATATGGKVAPDGSATATEVTVGLAGADDVLSNYGAFSASATLYPRLWVKCASGTFRVRKSPGTATGIWDIDCSVVAGNWTLINSASHAAVTESEAWVSAPGGNCAYLLSAASGTVTASVWAPTLTEEAGSSLAVIPTGASAVSTGDPVWAISNGLRNTGSQLLVDGDMEAAGVGDWTAGSGATLTKDATSPHGGSQSLKVAYNGTSHPYAAQTIFTIGTIYRVVGWASGDGAAYPRVRTPASVLWTGTSSTDWQAFDVTFVADHAQVALQAFTTVAGYSKFDDVTIYEQESYGPYYHTGDTVTQSITPFSGTCWDPLTSTADLLLSGLEGTQCAGIWYSLEVTP